VRKIPNAGVLGLTEPLRDTF